MTDVVDSDRQSRGNKDLVCMTGGITEGQNEGGSEGGGREGTEKTRGEVSAMHNPLDRMLVRAATCKQICISCTICCMPKRMPPLTVQNLMKYCNTVAAMNRQYTSE